MGAVYPYPMFEDGDFDLPSVYTTAEEGKRLAASTGEEATLVSRARRTPSHGCNVIARKGPGGGRRVVVMAHIDARLGTPGAGDNASGVAALLLLAEILSPYQGGLALELVAMNGEDYYANPGEMQFLASNAGKFGDIALGLNLDDVGYYRGKVAYSLYNCPPEIEALARGSFARFENLVEGPSWYQGDHGLFLFNGVPAIAFTSDNLAELMGQITHTTKDTPEMVNPRQLVEVARALAELLSLVAKG